MGENLFYSIPIGLIDLLINSKEFFFDSDPSLLWHLSRGCKNIYHYDIKRLVGFSLQGFQVHLKCKWNVEYAGRVVCLFEYFGKLLLYFSFLSWNHTRQVLVATSAVDIILQ